MTVLIREIHSVNRDKYGVLHKVVQSVKVPQSSIALALNTKVGAIPTNFFFSL
jgi:hypothetical protein